MQHLIPKVFARIVPSRGFGTSPALVVDKCPYCGHSHRHILREHAGFSFGTRQAECGRGEYELIDIISTAPNP